MFAKNTFIFMCSLGVSGVVAAQSQDAGRRAEFSDEARAVLSINESAQIEAGHRVRLSENAQVRVFEDREGRSGARPDLFLPQGSELEILETSKDGRIIRIGMDTHDRSLADLYISGEDLRRTRMTEVNFQEEIDAELAEQDADLEQGFFRSSRRGRGGGGMTYCYRDVKSTLIRAKKCQSYPTGELAQEGYEALARECGMQKRGNVDPSTLPPYSVCVSGGGRTRGCNGRACGHIAVKLPSGLWYGAGTRGSPYLPSSGKKGYVPRYVIGCLVP